MSRLKAAGCHCSHSLLLIPLVDRPATWTADPPALVHERMDVIDEAAARRTVRLDRFAWTGSQWRGVP